MAEYTAYLTNNVKILERPASLKQLGEAAAELIKKRTRLGYGVGAQEAEREVLEPLSEQYVEQRKKQQSGAKKFLSSIAKASGKKVKTKKITKQSLEKHGGLSQYTSPKKSNLTNTGQMLDSMGIIKFLTGGVVVGPSGKRRDGSLSNEEVASYVTIGGRPFNNLSRNEIGQLQEIARRIIDGVLKDA